MNKFTNFIVSILKSLIIIISISIIFSNTTGDINKVMSDSFIDIYEFASEKTKAKTISFLENNCEALTGESEALTVSELCFNETLFESFKSTCAEYRELKSQGIKIKNEQSLKESCEKIESGEIENECEEIKAKNIPAPDTNKLKEICNEYSSGKLDDKEFFTKTIIQPFGNLQNINIPLFQKYNTFTEKFKNNISILIIIIVALLIFMFLLIIDIQHFLLLVGKICFSLAMVIFLPYIAILAYDNFIGINTSSILEGIASGQPSLDPNTIISLVMVIILKTYNSSILILGAVLLVIGIAGKILTFFKKRNEEPKTS